MRYIPEPKIGPADKSGTSRVTTTRKKPQMTLRDELASVLGPGNNDLIAYDQADNVCHVLQAWLDRNWTGDRAPVRVLDDLQDALTAPSWQTSPESLPLRKPHLAFSARQGHLWQEPCTCGLLQSHAAHPSSDLWE